MMRKLVFLFVFLLLSSATAWNVNYAPAELHQLTVTEYDCTGADMPLGDAEENPEEDKSVTGEDDDDVNFDHRQHSRRASGEAGLQYIYQHLLFQNLEMEVIIPPPRA